MDASSKEKIVLIVDDDPMIRRTVQSIAKTVEGITTLTAASSKEGLELATKHHVSLIISDLNMPGQTGIWLLDHLRQDGNNVPVIIHSGSLLSGDDKELLRHGAARVISKPANAEVLRQAIRELAAD